MDRVAWKERLEALFAEASDLPESERAAFLERECAGDQALLVEVQSLLVAGVGAHTALANTVMAGASELAHGFSVGRRLGPYRLTEKLGEGGMGVVYLAERDDAEYRSTVAIKILSRDIASSEARARFRDERQILAELEHPGIVRLLDGGTEGSMPYLVMERVVGSPLTVHAREQALSVRARVELVRRICDGLAYAHDKRVIHRDIKPSNVLVTNDGTPKILDFGIAKLWDPTREREAQTRTGALLFTPGYASPEQARGDAVTPATDVYSLGAVLYELLVDRPPQPTTGTPLELVRTICEVEPVAPSKVVTTTRRQLVGDLDNIVLKALAKEPALRYPSARALADDLDNYLSGRAVVARTPSVAYRARKFARRHVRALGVVALGVVSAAVITVLALRGNRTGVACASPAQRLVGIWDTATRSKIVARFAASDKEFIRNSGLSAILGLDRAVSRWSALQVATCREDPRADPLLHAQRQDCLDGALRTRKGKVNYLREANLRDIALQVADMEPADLRQTADCENERAVRAQLPPLRDPDTRAREGAALDRIQDAVFQSRYHQKSLDDTRASIEPALKDLESLQSPALPWALTRYARLFTADPGQRELGNQLLDHAIDVADRRGDDSVLASALAFRAYGYLEDAETGRAPYASAEVTRLVDRAVIALERAGRPASPSLWYMHAARWHAARSGKLDVALELSREIIDVTSRAFGAESIASYVAVESYAEYLTKSYANADALREGRRAHEILVKALGPHHPSTAEDISFIDRLAQAGQLAEALQLCLEWQPVLDDTYGPGDSRSRELRDWTAHLLGASGRHDESAAAYREMIRASAPGDRRLAWVTHKYALELTMLGRIVEAMEQLRASEQLYATTEGIDSREAVRGPRTLLVFVLTDLGRVEEARHQLEAIDETIGHDSIEPALRDSLREQLADVRSYLQALVGDKGAIDRAMREAAKCRPDACGADRALILSQVLALRGRHHDRLDLLKPQLEPLRAAALARPKDRGGYLVLLTELGRSYLATKAPETIPTLELAVAEADTWPGATWVPDARFMLARALVDKGGDRERAAALAITARTEYGALGEGKRADERAVGAWLRRNKLAR